MLFVNIGKALPGDIRPAIARRLNWNYPEGFAWTTVPAITAQDGIALFKSLMQ